MGWARKRGGDGDDDDEIKPRRIYVHAERSEEISYAQQSDGRKRLFLPAWGAEKTGECDRCLRQAEEEVDFWLIQADSCEPPPKCSVEEILAFHRIHPSTHPRCPSALPLSVSPRQTLLTPSIWPPLPTPTVSLLHFYVLFRLSRGGVTRVASIRVFVGEKKAKKKERKKEIFSKGEDCCMGSVWRYNHCFKWQWKR